MARGPAVTSELLAGADRRRPLAQQDGACVDTGAGVEGGEVGR